MPMASLSLPAGATALKTLLEADGKTPASKVRKLILQAPSTNSNLAFFGDEDVQPFELAAGDPFFDVPGALDFGAIDISLFTLKGTPPDTIGVWWEDDPRG